MLVLPTSSLLPHPPVNSAPPTFLHSYSLDDLTTCLKELPLEEACAAFVAAVSAERGRLEQEARRMAAQQGSHAPSRWGMR